MIDLKTFNVKDNFFGARNSHDGFKSNFGKMFSPTKYEKLFILKGGPGTGKSTILRGVVSFANGVGITASAVLCSSDVSSLDGVILEHNGKRIGVIDGTAPHVQDPLFPGAIDEILNLGDGFNSRLLESQKREIIAYTKEKSEAYKNGYSTLFASKGAFDCIYSRFQASEFYNEAECIADEVMKEIDHPVFTHDNREGLYSAFGKDGFFSITPVGQKASLYIKGNVFVSSMALDAIKRRADKKGIGALRFSSALDDRITERIYIGDTAIISREEAVDGITLSDYDPNEYCVDFDELFGCYTTLLSRAALHFKNAASAHLSLEKIYREAVDFSKNEIIFDRLCHRIGDILL